MKNLIFLFGVSPMKAIHQTPSTTYSTSVTNAPAARPKCNVPSFPFHVRLLQVRWLLYNFLESAGDKIMEGKFLSNHFILKLCELALVVSIYSDS